MTKNNTIIAVSGASHSGKTTFIKNIHEKYKEHIVVIDENIRNFNLNIDEIRKNPIEYLNLEIDIISEKIINEGKYNLDNKNKIILLDRSLVDSYFYYTFYMDKNNLPKDVKEKYNKFLTHLKTEMYYNVNNLYDYIFMFEPITNITRKDEYTVNDIENVQDNEYFFIKNFTVGVCQNQRKVLDCNPKIANIIIDNIIEEINDARNN